jgi:hypothetical protein
VQTTLKITHLTPTPEARLQGFSVPVHELYDCRVAAMARMIAMLDAGVPFSVDHIPHDKGNAHPVRKVTLWDEVELHARE